MGEKVKERRGREVEKDVHEKKERGERFDWRKRDGRWQRRNTTQEEARCEREIRAASPHPSVPQGGLSEGNCPCTNLLKGIEHHTSRIYRFLGPVKGLEVAL